MRLDKVIKEATKIISVNMDAGKDYSPNPKADVGTNKIIHMDKKRVMPQVVKKDLKNYEYYIPDLPPGAWESLPPSWRKFYKDYFNSYPEVTFQPYTTMAKYYSIIKKLEKKYPQIPWRKLFPEKPNDKKVLPNVKAKSF